MPIPSPHDADSQGGGPLGQPTNRRPQDPPGRDQYGNEVWTPIPGKPGYYINHAGRLKYDPAEDPAHPLGPKIGALKHLEDGDEGD